MNEWDKKRDTMQHYDLTANIYDMQYAGEQEAKIEAAMKGLNIEKHGLVLDAGCGTGLLFNHIADKADGVVGLDISREILLQAKKRAKKFQNVNLIWADADHMPLINNAFSHIFAITLVQNMPDPVKTLNEAKRVAKTDAVIVVTGLKKKFTVEIFEELLRKVGLKVLEIRNGNLKCHVAICIKILNKFHAI
jgi:ubiquinone/menaquinone biosynthesis C-methylase UbiE